MSEVMLLVVLTGVLAVAGTVRTARSRLSAHGWHVLLWRWLTGHPWHGQPVTDAGWLRHGTRALTPTGHAGRWHHLPRWKRASHRSGGTLAVLAMLWLWLADPAAAAAVLASAVLLAFGTLVTVQWRWVSGRRNRRTWLHPLHLAAHELAGHPRALPARSWITLEVEDGAVRAAELKLPAGWPADPGDKQRLVSMVSAKLGIEAPQPTWRQAGPAPLLRLAHSEPPPSYVRYDELMDAVATAKSDELVVGFGKKRAVVKASLSLDSPHLAINMGTGGGKSTLAAWWLMQHLRRGGIAMVLDYKWFSQPWLIKDAGGEYSYLPNVAYLSSPAQIHAGLVWLARELDRRNQVALRAVTASGHLRGDVGPPIMVLAEELNYATPRLREYWTEVREPDDPKRSPALAALGAVGFAGRAVKIRLVLVGQMLTADATGSKDSSLKENIGVTAMARYGPPGWATAVGRNVPMPPSPSVLGRIQLAMPAGVRETQTPDGDLLAYRELVLAGEVTPCPAGMPGTRAAVPGTVPALHGGGSDHGFVSGAVPVRGLPGAVVTLSEAVADGVVNRSIGALRKASQRPGFPQRKGMRGLAAEYDALELAEWDARR